MRILPIKVKNFLLSPFQEAKDFAKLVKLAFSTPATTTPPKISVKRKVPIIDDGYLPPAKIKSRKINYFS